MNHPEGSRTRAIGALLNLLEARGIALDGLCDGLEYDLEEIGTAERWLSWNDTVELIDRVVDRVGGRRPFIELARLLPYHPATRPVFGFGRIALGPEPLYRLVAKYVGPNVFPTHRSEFEVLGPNRFRVTLSLPEDVRGCEDFFWAAYGTYVALPRVIGLGDAEVEAKISPHRGEL